LLLTLGGESKNRLPMTTPTQLVIARRIREGIPRSKEFNLNVRQ